MEPGDDGAYAFVHGYTACPSVATLGKSGGSWVVDATHIYWAEGQVNSNSEIVRMPK
jgi:hypothetical protein